MINMSLQAFAAGEEAAPPAGAEEKTPQTAAQTQTTSQTAAAVRHAEITVRDYGTIKLELDAAAAPITVENFEKLVKDGFYDGLIFHRIIPGFMIQGGDPEGTGMGGPGWHIKGEFAANGWDNPISHTRGVISMARAQDPNSAGSQFFIMPADADYLDGQYAAFGKVLAGMDHVYAVSKVATDRYDRPVEKVVIDSVRVDTKGVDYSNFEKIGG